MDSLEKLLLDSDAAYHARDYQRAYEILSLCLREFDHSATAHKAMADFLYQTGNYGAAVVAYRNALRLDEKVPSVRIRLGACHEAVGEIELAIQEFTAAIPTDPFLAHYNLSCLSYALGDPDKVLMHCDAALAFEEDDAELLARKAHALLTLGRFAEGWPLYEYRRKVADYVAWHGDPVDHLVIHQELGFGDTLQWARYVPLAAARCGRVTLAVNETLHQLFANSFAELGNVEVTATVPEQCDAFAWLDSLPYIFETDLSNIPPASYLKVATPFRLPFRRPLVGLCWAGGTGLRLDSHRSLPFAALDPLLDLEASFVSLQAEQFVCDSRISQVAMFTDWQQTAELVAGLDLVITVDTAIAHLAGSLGKPVWLLNRKNTCWRWMLDRTDSPWYRTMHIYRQPTIGDWSSVIATVRNDLSTWLQQRQ